MSIILKVYFQPAAHRDTLDLDYKIPAEQGTSLTAKDAREICEELKISPEEYSELLNEVRSVSLLNYDDLNSLTKTDKKSMLGLMENGKLNNPFAEVSRTNLKGLVEKAIADLPEKQRLVLALYYYEDMNLKEIGRVLEVTESRVSQLHTQAVLRLKAKLKNNFDEFVQLLA